MELPDEIQAKVDELFEQNEASYEEGNYGRCIELHKQAWALFPEPKLSYEQEGYSLVKGLVDLLRMKDNQVEADEWRDVLKQFGCGDPYETRPDAAELDDTIYEQIESLSEKGNDFADEGNFEGARQEFEKALALVPEPKTDWEAALWLYASLGDMNFSMAAYQASINNFYDALNCPDGNTNAFVLLRLGQALFETGEKEKGTEYLLRAYMLEGRELFGEDDQKYFDFLKSNVAGIH